MTAPVAFESGLAFWESAAPMLWAYSVAQLGEPQRPIAGSAVRSYACRRPARSQAAAAPVRPHVSGRTVRSWDAMAPRRRLIDSATVTTPMYYADDVAALYSDGTPMRYL